MAKKIRVTVWNEFFHEKHHAEVKRLYPKGMHTVIAQALKKDKSLSVRTATLEEKNHGLSQSVLNQTDVLFWWGHCKHGDVSDEIAKAVQKRVLEGMGLVALHSAHFSKPFKLLMGTNCSLKWREIGERERLWNIAPGHPITQGIGEYFELPHTEMYGERFDIPEPDQLIFTSWFQGGEVFRSGCVFNRGMGRVFYFRPGHETYPIFKDKNIQLILRNAAKFCAASIRIQDKCPNSQPLEKVPGYKAPKPAKKKAAKKKAKRK